MPLNLDELLKPIPGESPSGQDLRYEPVYDEIKEARREEDEGPQGAWARERKVAEWPVVIKLATDCIAKQSKDLQLAAWLTEAVLRKEGFVRPAQRPGTDSRDCWKTSGTRYIPRSKMATWNCASAPLSWLGLKLDMAVKSVPLVRGGYSISQVRRSPVGGFRSRMPPITPRSRRARKRSRKGSSLARTGRRRSLKLRSPS